MRNIFIRWFCVLCASVLTACASVPKHPTISECSAVNGADVSFDMNLLKGRDVSIKPSRISQTLTQQEWDTLFKALRMATLTMQGQCSVQTFITHMDRNFKRTYTEQSDTFFTLNYSLDNIENFDLSVKVRYKTDPQTGKMIFQLSGVGLRSYRFLNQSLDDIERGLDITALETEDSKKFNARKGWNIPSPLNGIVSYHYKANNPTGLDRAPLVYIYTRFVAPNDWHESKTNNPKTLVSLIISLQDSWSNEESPKSTAKQSSTSTSMPFSQSRYTGVCLSSNEVCTQMGWYEAPELKNRVVFFNVGAPTYDGITWYQLTEDAVRAYKNNRRV